MNAKLTKKANKDRFISLSFNFVIAYNLFIPAGFISKTSPIHRVLSV